CFAMVVEFDWGKCYLGKQHFLSIATASSRSLPTPRTPLSTITLVRHVAGPTLAFGTVGVIVFRYIRHEPIPDWANAVVKLLLG
ncbi:hypothetical protein LGN26_30260, partial [Burkholderia cepacia]|nr:hypothetical protein [Burkholderia cepacia]